MSMSQRLHNYKAHDFTLLAVFILIFGIWSALLGQDTNWDLLQYHFYNGYALLHHRSNVDIAPAMIQTYFNPFFDVVNYLLISIQKPWLTEFLLGSFSGVSCFFLYKIASLIFSSKTNAYGYIYASFATLIGMTGACSISLLNTTTNDTKMTMLCMIALYYALKGLTDNTAISRNLIISAFCSGICVGLKLPAICFSIGLFTALLFSRKLDKKQIVTLFIFSLFLLSGFAVANGYWMYTLYQQFGNPIFPMYNNIFHSEYAPIISFNFYVVKGELYKYHLIFLPYFLAFKNTLTTELVMRELRWIAIFALMILVLLANAFRGKNQRMPMTENSDSNPQDPYSRFIIVYFLSGYVAWILVFSLYRYLLPLELLTGILIVCLLRIIFSSHVKNGIALMLLTIIFFTTTIYPVWGNNESYGKSYFSFSGLPKLPPDSTVILTNVPTSYVIPFFQPDIKFIGMPLLTIGWHDARFNQLTSNKYLLEVMQNLSNTKPETIYTLGFVNRDSFSKKSLEALQYFGWKQTEKCHYFNDNIGHNFQLCSLTRIDKGLATL